MAKKILSVNIQGGKYKSHDTKKLSSVKEALATILKAIYQKYVYLSG